MRGILRSKKLEHCWIEPPIDFCLQIVHLAAVERRRRRSRRSEFPGKDTLYFTESRSMCAFPSRNSCVHLDTSMRKRFVWEWWEETYHSQTNPKSKPRQRLDSHSKTLPARNLRFVNRVRFGIPKKYIVELLLNERRVNDTYLTDVLSVPNFIPDGYKL